MQVHLKPDWMISLILGVSGALIFLLVIGMPSQAKTITVDDDGSADYLSIQEAIDNATNGDEIIVYSGKYFENVNVDKELRIIGHYLPEVISFNEEPSFTIISNNVTISNFHFLFGFTGIRIMEYNNITILDTMFTNVKTAIHASRTQNLSIINSTFKDIGILDKEKSDIYLNQTTLSPYDKFYADYITGSGAVSAIGFGRNILMKNNVLTSCDRGFGIQATNLTFINNNISYCDEYGLNVEVINSNISNNIFNNCVIGFIAENYGDDKINYLTNNTFNNNYIAMYKLPLNYKQYNNKLFNNTINEYDKNNTKINPDRPSNVPNYPITYFIVLIFLLSLKKYVPLRKKQD